MLRNIAYRLETFAMQSRENIQQIKRIDAETEDKIMRYSIIKTEIIKIVKKINNIKKANKLNQE